MSMTEDPVSGAVAEPVEKPESASGFGVVLWIAFVSAYRVLLSPMLGGACRFYPSCSEYSVLATRRHGLWRGIWMTARRLLRCHPFGAGGLDFP